MLRYTHVTYFNNAAKILLPYNKTNNLTTPYLQLTPRNSPYNTVHHLQILTDTLHNNPNWSPETPLWSLSDNIVASRDWLTSSLSNLIQFHLGESSFRAGGTTYYLYEGHSFEAIVNIGRWTSDTLHRYIRSDPLLSIALFASEAPTSHHLFF
jgi:hypothetical protein